MASCVCGSSLLLPWSSNFSSVVHQRPYYYSFKPSLQCPSQSLVAKPSSSLQFKRDLLLFSQRTKQQLRRNHRPRLAPVSSSLQSNIFKVLQTAWRVGKDGVEAGTNLVPDSIPRPIARISVTGAAMVISLFVIKSLLSTVFFVLAMMGLIYFVFIALNKDEGPKGGGGGDNSTTDEDPLQEARRIMEKYK